jgi:hypothetical protein
MVRKGVEVFVEVGECEKRVLERHEAIRSSNAPSIQSVKGVNGKTIFRKEHGEIWRNCVK